MVCRRCVHIGLVPFLLAYSFFTLLSPGLEQNGMSPARWG